MSAQLSDTNTIVNRKNMSFDDKTLQELAAQLSDKKESLQLDNCQLGKGVNIQALVKSLESNTTLHTIIIKDSQIDPQNLKALCEALIKSKAPLRTFFFTYNSVDFAGLKCISEVLKQHRETIEHINLSGCRFATMPESFFQEATETQSNNTLPFNKELIESFSRVIYNCNKLISLQLKDCGLYHPDLIHVLSKGLMHSATLKSLDLSNNFMSDSNVHKIFSRLVNEGDLPDTLSSLEKMNLSGNFIMDNFTIETPAWIFRNRRRAHCDWINPIAQVKKSNQPPLILDLSNNALSATFLDKLKKVQSELSNHVVVLIENNFDQVSKHYEENAAQMKKEMDFDDQMREQLTEFSGKQQAAKFELIKKFEQYRASLRVNTLLKQEMERKDTKESKETKSETKALDETQLIPFMKGVTTGIVSLKHKVLTESSLEEIGTSLKNPQDTANILCISRCTLPQDANFESFLSLIISKNVKKIVISHSSIDFKQFKILCSLLTKYGKIDGLVLSNIKLTGQTQQDPLLSSMVSIVLKSNTAITYLDLSGNNLSEGIPDFKTLQKLETLILKECNLNENSQLSSELASRIKATLRELDLSKNNLTSNRAVRIIEYLNAAKNFVLNLHINLSSNLLSSPCVHPLINNIFSYSGFGLDISLRGVNLSDNSFSKEDLEKFALVEKRAKIGQFFIIHQNEMSLADELNAQLEKHYEKSKNDYKLEKERILKSRKDLETQGQEQFNSFTRALINMEKALRAPKNLKEVKERLETLQTQTTSGASSQSQNAETVRKRNNSNQR